MLKIFDIKKKLPSIFMFSLIIAGIAIYYLLYAEIKKENWTPGPISHSHSFIEKDCKTCHLKSFTKIEDVACLSCHNLTQHSDKIKDNSKSTCVTCHQEHQGEQKLSLREDQKCISCHLGLDKKYSDIKIKNVSNFTNHPEFSRITKDTSTIKLNHELHLKPNLRSANGTTKLNCNDCHKVDKLGRRMIPIKYETTCASCHSLEFDERLPGRAVPHGKTDIVYNFLFREYAALYLKEEQLPADKRLIRPGVDNSQTVNPDYALRKVQDVTREIEKDLILNRGCVLCHEITERKTAHDKKSIYHVRNPGLPSIWMKRAVFKHGAHEFASCDTCHAEAKKSKATGDVLLPELKDCNTCHGQGSAPKDCLTCHSFHDSQAVEFMKKQPVDKFH